jgi:hypothetical protein
MLIQEYEVKVALDGDYLILTHRNDHGSTIIRTYDSEDFTAADAAKDLIRNLYDIEPEIQTSGDIPGGHLYLLVEAQREDE